MKEIAEYYCVWNLENMVLRAIPYTAWKVEKLLGAFL